MALSSRCVGTQEEHPRKSYPKKELPRKGYPSIAWQGGGGGGGAGEGSGGSPQAENQGRILRTPFLPLSLLGDGGEAGPPLCGRIASSLVTQPELSSSLGSRALAPCVTCPHPETDRLEAKQLRMCLLSKRELSY